LLFHKFYLPRSYDTFQQSETFWILVQMMAQPSEKSKGRKMMRPLG